MTPARHPLTTLSREELPGWIAAMEWQRDVLNAQPPMVATGHLMERVIDMHAIADGLLSRAGPARDAERRMDGLADAVASARHAPPRQSGGHSTVVVYTPERVALLRRLWPTMMPPTAVLDQVNAIPGAPPVASTMSLGKKAQSLGVRREGLPIPEEFRPAPVVPDAPPPVVDVQLRPTVPGRRPDGAGLRSMAELDEAEMADIQQRYIASVENVPDLAAAFRVSAASLYSKASGAGWRRTRPQAVALPTPPAAPLPPHPPMSTEDRHEARERLRTGKLRGARDLVEEYGCTPEEAQEIVDAHRAAQSARAA